MKVSWLRGKAEATMLTEVRLLRPLFLCEISPELYLCGSAPPCSIYCSWKKSKLMCFLSLLTLALFVTSSPPDSSALNVLYYILHPADWQSLSFSHIFCLYKSSSMWNLLFLIKEHWFQLCWSTTLIIIKKSFYSPLKIYGFSLWTCSNSCQGNVYLQSTVNLFKAHQRKL